MKKLIISLLIVLLLPAMALAAHLAWDYTDSSMLKGWKFYYQSTADASNTYIYTFDDPSARTLDMGALQLIPGTEYMIWMTAYNAHAESAKSNTVDFTAPDMTFPPDSHPIVITIPAPATLTITRP